MRRTETFTSWSGATTGNHTSLTIDLPSGTVEVRGVDTTTVTVHLDTDQPAEWEVSQFGDTVSVRADVTLEVVLRYLRMRGELPDRTDRLFVVNR